jgi:integrase
MLSASHRFNASASKIQISAACLSEAVPRPWRLRQHLGTATLVTSNLLILAASNVRFPVVVEIGKKAGIRVSERKTASAHDLQRSFGLRWADRVKPHVLQQLMRHASSQTTLTFYVQSDAADMAELVWSAFEKGAKSGTKTVPNRKTTSDELSGIES